ncbi:hypothetical protein [Gordonia zhaorongruii]|uniref:hypothetical protein n=1 Tax=Gordonia zhaorongruii TaxID=2597659 RepID=UPI00105106D2|nr:hypothetical protein [Gordonia zhaorongruii]
MLDELNSQARALYAAGDFARALADYSVLREIRSRREGPYSVKYLAALHDCVRCMSRLRLWTDSDLLCSELHSRYVRTHGRGGDHTVDVARHWGWALAHLNRDDGVAALCVTTADAVWVSDPVGADLLLGAAASQDVDSAGLARSGLIDGVTLAHPPELVDALVAWRDRLDADHDARASAMAAGLAPRDSESTAVSAR